MNTHAVHFLARERIDTFIDEAHGSRIAAPRSRPRVASRHIGAPSLRAIAAAITTVLALTRGRRVASRTREG